MHAQSGGESKSAQEIGLRLFSKTRTWKAGIRKKLQEIGFSCNLFDVIQLFKSRND